MIRINSLKLRYDHGPEALREAAAARLHISVRDIAELEIVRRSLDARDKTDIRYIYSVDVSIKNEKAVLSNKRIKDIAPAKKILYNDPFQKGMTLQNVRRPIIIGFGPAGMFCAYKLAKAGLRPIVFERGRDVDSRRADVEQFWSSGRLNTSSNVQFGEGGAGTFSDGKLNTMIHDHYGRIGEVFNIFVEHGADPSIRYNNKPHIGTDALTGIIRNIREDIIASGGEVHFNSCLTDIKCDADGHVAAVTINDTDEYTCSELVLAIGHSARDTFRMLQKFSMAMEPKPFAIGVRVQHPQSLIGRAQYGDAYEELPAADYKVTYQCPDGRSVYSFCMCPGGFVVNASSEEGRLAVNGMSNAGRDEVSANSAIVVSVDTRDYAGYDDCTVSDVPAEHDALINRNALINRDAAKASDALAGMYFQQELERKCYELGGGAIPGQYLADFMNGRATAAFDLQQPNTKGQCVPADLHAMLPDFVSESITQAMPHFGRIIKGFDADDTLLLGLESRTSSPVRLLRDDSLQSQNMAGIYPCGEGAGYAGGITSAAVDGIKVYEEIILKYGAYYDRSEN